MQLFRVKKILALALCLLLFSAIAFSLIFMVKYAEHECCDDTCPTCAQIYVAQRLFTQIGAALAAALCVVSSFKFLRTLPYSERLLLQRFNPVTLKVRLDF